MFAGSLLVGFTVIMVAVWLEYNDSLPLENGDKRRAIGELASESAMESSEIRYRRTRRRWRMVIHLLLALCGALMVAAGWAGPGKFWIASWTAVAMLMACIVVLALGDAVRTHTHHVRKVSETKRALNKRLNTQVAEPHIANNEP